MPRKPRTPAPSAPLPGAMTLAEAVADVDALFGVTSTVAGPAPGSDLFADLDAIDAIIAETNEPVAEGAPWPEVQPGEGTPIVPTNYRAIEDSTPNGDGTHSVWVAPVDAPGPYVVRANPLDYLTPAECHAVYRAVQSGRIRVAEWTGGALQTVTGSPVGNVYALPNGGYAGRTGGRIEEFGTEAEARAAVEGHAAEAGWTVTR